MKRIILWALVVAGSFGSPAVAQPVTLKLAYFSSDRTLAYTAAIQPFASAVNAASAGQLIIEINASGVLGRDPTQQLQLVLEGKADIAFIVPGYTPERFPDNEVIELPGLFGGVYEATKVYSRLIAEGALEGYEDLFVIGAFATEPTTIHSHLPIGSLADLAGQRIRGNNPIEIASLNALGMSASMVPLNQSSNAISGGTLDAASSPPGALVEFGISRVVTNHHILNVASVPLALVMSREVFDALPPGAQEVIAEFSGEWAVRRYIAAYEAADERALEMFLADPGRRVIIPSEADKERAAAIFASIVEDWLGRNPRHPELLAAVQNQLLDVRLGL